MQGLLGPMDDPQSAGLLSLGLRLMSTPGNFGTALGSAGLGAMGDMQQAQQMQEQRKRQEQYALMQKLQMDQMLDQQRRQKESDANDAQFRATIQPPLGGMMPGAPAMNAAQAESAVGMPGYGASAASPQRAPIDPNQAMLWNALQTKQMTPMQYYQALQKDDTPIPLADGGMLVTKSGKLLASNPKEVKPEAAPSAVREYEYAKAQGYGGTFQQFQTEMKKAGASSVSVNTGQKGLDNTLKLRGDFRSEPVYKAHQEMTSAYSQIQQSLKQASPAGDLAGATKLMKLLDPGSVVRESELGMAMAASGLMDRVENYAKNIMSGNKLTPTQRADFQKLADALYAESVSQYNSKRTEYEGIATRNGLSVPDVLGSAGSVPKPAGSVDSLVDKYRSR